MDVIIAGLGGAGSAAAYHLARRGVRVLGLDRFGPGHAQGSSHGRTRIIREAYAEHPLYVPLVQRAYARWAELEAEAEDRLFRRTGGLMIGPPRGALVSGALLSAGLHRLPHERLDAAALRARFPPFRAGDAEEGVWEPRAGVLFPERCVRAHLEGAARAGAELSFDEPVLAWEAGPAGVRVRTRRGSYEAARLLLAAGAWTRGLLPELELPLTLERQAPCWFAPQRNAGAFAPERFPVFIHEDASGALFYGFPDFGDGVKAALHHGGEAAAEPGAVRREVRPEDVEAVRRRLQPLLPDADGPLRAAETCLYTNTPDRHFLLDAHPRHPAVFIASPCSGHGFKFSSAVGELLAALVTGADPGFDLAPFRIGRFGAGEQGRMEDGG